MSPTCVVLSPFRPADGPISAAGPVELVIHANFTSSKTTGRRVQCWVDVLSRLKTTPVVASGTPQELFEYQCLVKSCIQQAASLVSQDSLWSDCDGLSVGLSRALELVSCGKTTSGRDLAVELLTWQGFAHRLAGQLKSVGAGAGNALGAPTVGLASQPACSNSSSNSSMNSSASTSSSTAFKVPALPAKRQRSPESDKDQLAQLPSQPQEQQQQHRRHCAPKRRATPQVLAYGPVSITPTAPPDSATHGEACCDEQLLSCWCPISGKRQKCVVTPAEGPASTASQGSSTQESSTSTGPQLPSGFSNSNSNNAAGASPSADASQLLQHQQQPLAGPLQQANVLLSKSAARNSSIETVKRLMHEDPVSKPAADVLLFSKGTQLPIVNWTGTIKHRADGRVVEVCTVSLQVPEPFLEEFPAALYAADVRHRRSVSLGRHVVCRATLNKLSEHQLACLAAMARNQLVALCALQTAELHLVPYFDNKNMVRLVGFLKIKAV